MKNADFLIREEVDARVEALEIDFNKYGFDAYGVSKWHLKVFFSLMAFFYEDYFKVETTGIERVPDRGRAMLVGNHSGGIAIDAGMVATSVFFHKDPPRLAQGMADKFLSKMPIISQWTNRIGQLTGLPSQAKRLLEEERLLMVYPEGAKGTAKLFEERRSLVHFGQGFVRLAMQTKTPIIPVVYLGGGETFPTIYNSKYLGRLFGTPYIPFTPYLLPIPLPVPCEIHFGEPLFFEGDGDEPDHIINEYVGVVKEAIRKIIKDYEDDYDVRLREYRDRRENERLFPRLNERLIEYLNSEE